MNKIIIIFFILIITIILTLRFLLPVFSSRKNQSINPVITLTPVHTNQFPLAIDYMRGRKYSGSPLMIEKTLNDGANYHQYIASYESEGLKIYGLLTVPTGEMPKNGWPVIIFNHGYIPPKEYRTTERYVAYVDSFARNGYIVFKPDYRGNGNSEGKAAGAYYSPDYTIDVLNAVTALKKYKSANPNRIGMWGHSMGGNITLRVMVISSDIKAGVIWAGVVGTYEDLLYNWRKDLPARDFSGQPEQHVNEILANLQKTYGTPTSNPNFWHSIDPRFYLKDISGPLQIHQGLADETVPVQFSEGLANDLQKEGKTAEYYTYPGGDHNLASPHFDVAMQRSVDFFNKYVKGS